MHPVIEGPMNGRLADEGGRVCAFVSVMCICVSVHVCVNMLGCDLELMELAVVDGHSLLRMRRCAQSSLIFWERLCITNHNEMHINKR